MDKEILKELLLENPTFNNVEITKLYNEKTGENNNPEVFRKKVRKVRQELNMGNPASVYTSKKFYNTQTYKKEDNVDSSRYRYTQVDAEKGTLKSEIVVSFEPRDDKELAELHKVDLKKYKISNYWTKLQPDGKFTSSLLCSLRKLGDSITADEVKDIIKDALKENTKKDKIKFNYKKVDNKKALIFWISDEHVGASVSGSIYENNYNENEYFKRKSQIIKIVEEQYKLHGRFDEIIFCSLGDNLDGFNASTTRSLKGTSTHVLEQNMTNAEAIRTYVEVNKIVIDGVIDLDYANNYTLYNVNNSNHGGLGFDYMGSYALKQYLETKYKDIKIVDFHKIIDKFSYGKLNFFLTHGKDEKHMSKGLPLMLNPNIENYLKEFIDNEGCSKNPTENIIVKGDLHQFATQQGKWFSYQNCPSLFGSSAWVHANFGKGLSGFTYSIVGDKDSSVTFNPYWF